MLYTCVNFTGIVHPQEVGALICGFIYYITIPSMYMLLLIYSVFNMNDVSWGTREVAPKKVIERSLIFISCTEKKEKKKRLCLL